MVNQAHAIDSILGDGLLVSYRRDARNFEEKLLRQERMLLMINGRSFKDLDVAKMCFTTLDKSSFLLTKRFGRI
jgi:type II secretory pathway component PulC